MKTNHSRWIITTTILAVGSRAAAQPPLPLVNYAYDHPIRLTPAMIIVFLSIIAIFVLMVCLSVHTRRFCGGVGVGGGGGGGVLRRASVYGLDPTIIATFPVFVYSEVKGLKIGKGALECAVCLCEFDDVDTLRLIPKCCHVFHQVCIDTWLDANLTCPVCRAMLVPHPGDDQSASFVLPVREPELGTTDDDIAIDLQSPEKGQAAQTPQHEQPVPVPSRSASRKNRMFGKFKRSFTTGHVRVVKPEDDYTRFTLRLPEEVQSKLVRRSLGQTETGGAVFPRANGFRSASVGDTSKRSVMNYDRFEPEGRPDRWRFRRTPSMVSRSLRQTETGGAVFPRARSQRNGFRSASVGDTSERSVTNYERFEPEGRPDRWRFRRTLSMVSLTGSVQSPNRMVGNIEVGNASMNLSSFQFGADDSIKEDVNVGERSFDRLKFDGDQV